MTEMNHEQIHQTVREHYAKVACSDGVVGCAPSCCGATSPDMSLALGYSEADLAAVPDGANMGLGCGNPQAIAALRAGETVLDLGSGGGFDCFLAARQVGADGAVIGVDMTPEMIDKSKRNAQTMGIKNVDFRLGQIEHLPVADASVDVIMSNCVVNLSPDKAQVYRETFRALRPGGRLAISDVVALAPLPAALQSNVAALAGCVAGAATVDDIKQALQACGFEQIRVTVRPESRAFIGEWFPNSGVEDYVASAIIEAIKPKPEATCCGPTCCA